MHIRRINVACLLLFFAAYGDDAQFKEMMRTIISFRADGKMDIPKQIKHIKLDIGLSYNAPMSQYWLSHEDDLFCVWI